MQTRYSLTHSFYLLSCLCVFFVCGCASILSKSKYPVTITSSPEGATVIVKNKKGEKINTIATPNTIILPASSGYFSAALYTFEFQRGEDINQTKTLSAHLDAWYFGNILFGGLIGFIFIDPLTGAMWKLDEKIDCSFSDESAVFPVHSVKGEHSNMQTPNQQPSKAQTDQLDAIKESGMLIGIP